MQARRLLTPEQIKAKKEAAEKKKREQLTDINYMVTTWLNGISKDLRKVLRGI